LWSGTSLHRELFKVFGQYNSYLYESGTPHTKNCF
jgi:hypothetical protein